MAAIGESAAIKRRPDFMGRCRGWCEADRRGYIKTEEGWNVSVCRRPGRGDAGGAGGRGLVEQMDDADIHEVLLLPVLGNTADQPGGRCKVDGEVCGGVQPPPKLLWCVVAPGHGVGRAAPGTPCAMSGHMPQFTRLSFLTMLTRLNLYCTPGLAPDTAK